MDDVMLVLLGFGLAVVGFGILLPPGPNRPPWLNQLVGAVALVVGLIVALLTLAQGD